MKQNFSLIIMIVFIVFAILGVLVFSGVIPLGKKTDQSGGQGTVVLWGTVPNTIMSVLIEEFNNSNPNFIVKYEQKSPDTFDQNLLEALASGTGPDMFLLPDNLALHYTNKIFTIPYQSIPLATFKSSYASAGEVFLSSKGIIALPLVIDPLMMYYNRSTLDANSIVYPPSTWDDLVSLVPTLTKKDDANKIMKSAVAMGHFSNVTNAKDLLAALFMQAGDPIIAERDGAFTSVLGKASGARDLGPFLKFYTDFADPLNSVYSWNKSFPSSVDTFSSEDLAFYFGFASELTSLVNKNPNQNFFVAPMPQIKNSNFKLTSAHVTGIAISSSSKNFNTAFVAANLMSGGSFASKLANALGVAPARRALLAVKPADAFSPIFYNSALFAKSWLDPSPKDTDIIFNNMVENVLSGNLMATDSIDDASSKLHFLLIK